MKIRFSLVLATLLILVACTPKPETPLVSNLSITPTLSQSPTSTFVPDNQIVFPQDAPPPTPAEQISVMTSNSPEIRLTALNLQLESNSQKLTQAANQIATMSAESSVLETQLAQVSTSAANSSSKENSNTTQYNIPSNVYTVVTVDRAVIFVPHAYNDAGAPIMLPYEPRVVLPEGTEAWVYKKQIKADGGAIYYESYDPDGHSELKVYFKAIHIQIRLSNGKPDPANYPPDVAKAQITDNTALFVVTSYDNEGKPVMDTYKPRIRYTAGSYEIVYPNFVVGTGGTQWYPVYDPDGKPSGYIRSIFISFPQFWE